jgi:hypothetical protein
MRLTHLNIDRVRVTDLPPLRGMPLQWLTRHGCPVGEPPVPTVMPLQELGADLDPVRDARLLRAFKQLKTINGQPAERFLGGAGAPGASRP